MSYKSFFAAALLGVSLAISSFTTSAVGETLRVMEGAPSSVLNVPMDRAVVVESDGPFAELSIANPNFADISTLSDRIIYVIV